MAIVQGNIAQDQKWRPEIRELTLERYAALTRERFDADLVVWPETAMPGFFDTLRGFAHEILAEAVRHGSAVVTGVPMRDAPGGPYLNAVAFLGSEPGFYIKRRLVPFGEYLPFAFVLGPVVEALGIRMANFSPGPRDQEPMRLGPHALGVSICYEIAFATAVRLDLPEAALLVTVSNDAWFGNSIGPHQHLEIARVRAAETGRWLGSCDEYGAERRRLVTRGGAWPTPAVRGGSGHLRGGSDWRVQPRTCVSGMRRLFSSSQCGSSPGSFGSGGRHERPATTGWADRT